MSTTSTNAPQPATSVLHKESSLPSSAVAAAPKRDYKGFVAGVFSGVAKLSGEIYLHAALLFMCVFENGEWRLKHDVHVNSGPSVRFIFPKSSNEYELYKSGRTLIGMPTGSTRSKSGSKLAKMPDSRGRLTACCRLFAKRDSADCTRAPRPRWSDG